ncbi:hypothetical protein ACW4TU_21480 [Streptomyces sp. QTS52]
MAGPVVVLPEIGLPDVPGLFRGKDFAFTVTGACDTVTTRALTSYFRKAAGMPRRRVHGLGYWQP